MNDKKAGEDEPGSETTPDSVVSLTGEVIIHDGIAVEDEAARAVEGLEEHGFKPASAEDLALHPDQVEIDWYNNVYKGDHVPQLTLRAVIVGGLLGALMSLSNLYTMIKLGWGFGVAVTACVLSFVIWNGVRTVFPKVSAMSILENTCMQSTASAAGYSTGSTIATAFGAYLLITGHQIDWHIMMPWTFVTAGLGVFIAIPMKRQMINREQLAFPTGIAAAETLKSLYSKSKQAVQQAHSLVAAMVAGIVVAILRVGNFGFLKVLGLELKELYPFPYSIAGGNFPGFGFEPSLMLIGAGMIVGQRVCTSMVISSALLYLVFGPHAVAIGEITNPAKLISGWGLWTGTAMMVTSGLTAFGLQWKTIARSFSTLSKSRELKPTDSRFESIEVPTKWFLMGVIPFGIAMALLQYIAFSIAIPLGILSVVLSFFLGLVAARSTGETDITPIGAMGKLTQLTYAVIAPTNAVTNLMTASVTANTAIASSDLLTDLKSGYLLGANPRKQFFAQFIGVFFGTAAVVPAWYLMIPTKEILEKYNPPSTNMWLAVAEALTHGIQYVPLTARYGMLIGAIIGIVLTLCDHFFPKQRKYFPSAMGLGLAWVFTFNNSLSFFIGASIASLWKLLNKRTAEIFTVSVASGAIAGESLACAIIAIISAAAAIAAKH